MKPGAVIFAKDITRVATFYQTVLAMTVAHSEKDVVVLESPDQQLVIHRIPPRIARTISIASPPRARDGAAVKLVFPVASIAEVRSTAVRLGGAVSPKKKEFVARGFRACDGHDPEGNVIQFREDAKER